MALFHHFGKNKFLKKIFILLALFSSFPLAWADTSCENFPLNCSKGSSSGSANPSKSDGFSVNPSGIPTETTAFGLEGIWSSAGTNYPKTSLNTSIIKGYQRVGSALTSGNGHTFYSFNLLQAHQETGFQTSAEKVAAESTAEGTTNIGGALALVRNSAKAKLVPTLGASARYNKLTKTWGPGYGVTLNSKFLSLGWGAWTSAGSVALGIPETSASNLNASARFGNVNVEYTYINYSAKGLPTIMADYSHPVSILTGSLAIKRCIFTVAKRQAVNILNSPISLMLFAFQLQVSSHIALAYLHNYIPGAYSLGLQIFL